MKTSLRWIIVLVLFIISILLWTSIFSTRDNLLKVVFLDVGQGDSIFIETPSKKQLLIDGGSNRKVLSSLSKVMPFYDKSLDVVIGTHPDSDHIGGLVHVLQDYEVGLYLSPQISSDTTVYKSIQQIVQEVEIQKLTTVAGQRISLGENTFIEILFPYGEVDSTDTNDHSVVALLWHGKNKVLLTGDASVLVEQALADIFKGKIHSAILKVGHHGSKTSSNKNFLEIVKPLYTIISASCDNRFGHPNQIVLDNLEDINAEIISTCESGNITFLGDGEKFWREN